MAIPKFYTQKEIERRRNIFTRVWKLEDIGRPIFQIWETGATHPTYKIIKDTSLLLESELRGLEACSKYRCDGPPFLSPYAGVGVIPSAFGCEIVIDEVNEPETLRLIDRTEDVYKLKKPRPDAGMMAVVLNQLKYLNEINQGYYDIRMHDLQGPFSVASLIWGYEDFLAGVLTHPGEAHHLLRLVTEYIIDVVEAQRKIVPNLILCHCCPDWIPPSFGISVSDDIAAVVSPQIYKEFAVPYNNILSAYFGGIFIHSCGNCAANYETMLLHKNFRGLNFEATDNPYPEAVEKLGRKSLIAPHPGLQFKIKFGNALGYVNYMLKNTPKGVPYVISLWSEMFNPITGKSEKDTSIDEAIGVLNSLSMDPSQIIY